MFRYKTIFVLIFCSLIFASVACRLPGGNSNVPIPVSTEAAGELEENIEKAADALRSGDSFTLSITESQLTSLANQELQSSEGAQITNLQIYLREGQIQAFGEVLRDGIILPVSISLSLSTDAQGQIVYQVLQATIGPFPIPESILAQLTEQFDQSIMSQIDPDQTNIFLDQITIANGVMTLSGHAN